MAAVCAKACLRRRKSSPSACSPRDWNSPNCGAPCSATTRSSRNSIRRFARTSPGIPSRGACSPRWPRRARPGSRRRRGRCRRGRRRCASRHDAARRSPAQRPGILRRGPRLDPAVGTQGGAAAFLRLRQRHLRPVPRARGRRRRAANPHPRFHAFRGGTRPGPHPDVRLLGGHGREDRDTRSRGTGGHPAAGNPRHRARGHAPGRRHSPAASSGAALEPPALPRRPAGEPRHRRGRGRPEDQLPDRELPLRRPQPALSHWPRRWRPVRRGPLFRRHPAGRARGARRSRRAAS